MNVLNAILNRWVDLVMVPFRLESPWPGMLAVSFLTTALVLIIFKFTSNPMALRKRKNRALARLLEFILFKDDIVVNLGAFGRVLVANLVYLGSLFVPLVVSLIPVVLILIQLSCWLGIRPVRVGETTVLTARLRGDLPVLKQELAIETSQGFVLEAGPVRVLSRNEASWRLRAKGAGAGWVDLDINGTKVRKCLVSGNTMSRLAPERPQMGFWAQFLHPGESPLPAGSPVSALEVAYPESGLKLAGRSYHWLFVFFVLSLAFGLILMKPMKATV